MLPNLLLFTLLAHQAFGAVLRIELDPRCSRPAATHGGSGSCEYGSVRHSSGRWGWGTGDGGNDGHDGHHGSGNGGDHGGKDQGGGGKDLGGQDGHDSSEEGGGEKTPGTDGKTTDPVVDTIINDANTTTHDDLPTVNNGTIGDMVDSGAVIVDPNTPTASNDTLPAQNDGAATSITGQFGPEQGTNVNAPTVGDAPSYFIQGDIDYGARMTDPAVNPDLLIPKAEPKDRCEYTYAHVLGGGGTTPVGDLWALEGYVDLVAADIKQGGIGDCGLGASVISLANNGWIKHLTSRFIKRFDYPNPGDRNMIAVFQKDGVTQASVIDDQLPTLTNANPNCWTYPGFQPVDDAAKPDANGHYPPTPIFFMPLLEKAFAKFLDNNPDWKSSSATGTGYSALPGIRPDYALAALTGGKPKVTWRTRAGFDPGILIAAIGCMRSAAPCVIDTGSTALEGLGTKDQFGVVWLNPQGSGDAFVSGTTSGMVAADAPSNEKTFTAIDFDQRDQTGKYSTAVTLVNLHAYAFDAVASSDWPLTGDTTLETARITVINPWATNPEQKIGGGTGNGVWGGNPKVTMSFRTFVQVVRAIYTVEDMPAL